MTCWIWSDLHFNHAGILKYCAKTRPVADVAEMNEWLITLWNENVKAKDSIYIVGDFAFGGSNDGRIQQLFSQLNGKSKYLILGNHDEKNKGVAKLGWEGVWDIRTLRGENKMRAVLCHYPMATWKNAHHDYIMLHGHCHGNLEEEIPHRFDVGVDAQYGPSPNTLEFYWELAKTQTFNPVDHHGA